MEDKIKINLLPVTTDIANTSAVGVKDGGAVQISLGLIKDITDDLDERTDTLEILVDGLEGATSKLSFEDVAAATSYWTTASPKPDDDTLLNIEDIDWTYKWASGETEKVLAVRKNVSITDLDETEALSLALSIIYN